MAKREGREKNKKKRQKERTSGQGRRKGQKGRAKGKVIKPPLFFANNGQFSVRFNGHVSK